MNIASFADLLRNTMGLNAASIGISAIERALGTRMRTRAVASHDLYWDVLQHSQEELQQLIEAVVVPETWFFRDPQVFAAMAEMATNLWRGGPARPLRLLSLPCSTGEEPYTMAMALLDAGLPFGSFRIDAVDISAHSLTKARVGIFGRNSFRSRDLAFRDRHFEGAEGGFRISDAVRAPVHFCHGNILDRSFLAEAEPYDIIFCRNLLIYFDAPTQSRAIAALQRLLTPVGMLFVGHSEAGLMPAEGFVSAKIPMAFAFRKTPLQRVTQAAAAVAGSFPRQPSSTPPRTPAKSRRPIVSTPPAQRAKVLSPVQSHSVEHLHRMADNGRLDEAASGIEKHLRQSGPSTEALLLLAMISDARGDAAAAVRHYRKVLYLEPSNHEALGHLALLLKKQGNHAGAKLIDERIRRNERSAP